MIQVFTNKHLITAMIVTPILAFIAYYAVDYTVSEKPHQARKGQSYPLQAKSNCRYQSGHCTFKNGDITIDIKTKKTDDNVLSLTLTSNLAIQGAKVAIASDNTSPAPQDMRTTDRSRENWHITLANTLNDSSRLQIALMINDSLYYGETGTRFTTYKTGFSQDAIHAIN
jgi:hypothetical protein